MDEIVPAPQHITVGKNVHHSLTTVIIVMPILIRRRYEFRQAPAGPAGTAGSGSGSGSGAGSLDWRNAMHSAKKIEQTLASSDIDSVQVPSLS